MRIALVEDEAKLRNSLKEGIEAEGYHVDTFASGELFEREFEPHEHRYDVVVLDLMLPGKPGLEVCRDMRSRGSVTPVLVLTAKSGTKDKVELFDAGADDFVTKPFSFEELLARFRALSRRPHDLTRPKIKIKDLLLDTNKYTATRAGKPVQLTSTEFELLQFLMERKGQVMTRDRISNHLWGLETAASGNVVDVHISNLRKKIHDDHDEEIIRTVRGAGYLVQE
jgi:DNA-binding response OmpR family regulator